ncbi:hypothetical protein BX265_7583 [Streptomyces sp. TLI_235]|nr:hypothetical protein BX265_7583 [Streptomyces sp. TLI_235]
MFGLGPRGVSRGARGGVTRQSLVADLADDEAVVLVGPQKRLHPGRLPRAQDRSATYSGVGLMIANGAPCGSATTDIRPAIMSNGGASTVPFALTRASTVESTSSTAK